MRRTLVGLAPQRSRVPDPPAHAAIGPPLCRELVTRWSVGEAGVAVLAPSPEREGETQDCRHQTHRDREAG